MGKKEAKKPAGRTDSVRAAAAQALGVTAGQAGSIPPRAQALADELVHVASRVREVLDELRPTTAEEARALRERLDALEARVAALEVASKRTATTRRRTTPKKPQASP